MDRDWMPRLVLMAKSTYVWLDQLSKQYGRHIGRLDADPGRGARPACALGLHRPLADRALGAQPTPRSASSSCAATPMPWRPPIRSTTTASRDDLGGEAAFEDLKDRAWARGIRMASDMVPNHMGIDSRWVDGAPGLVHLACPTPPYPVVLASAARTCRTTTRVGIYLEDHYYDHTDAAVVFKRVDRRTGERALHLPRQRRHQHAVERHRPARLPEARGPRGRHPDDPRTSRGSSR